MKITVYSLTYDHNAGIGTVVHLTEQARDADFREAIRSFGIEIADDEDPWSDRIDEALGEKDARFAGESHEIELDTGEPNT